MFHTATTGTLQRKINLVRKRKSPQPYEWDYMRHGVCIVFNRLLFSIRVTTHSFDPSFLRIKISRKNYPILERVVSTKDRDKPICHFFIGDDDIKYVKTFYFTS